MRTFKFRGKGIKSGQWFYGSVVPFGNSAYIFKMFRLLRMEHAEVDPATVGQFTGLFDKNGKEIYEGDIISSKKHPQIKHLIFYNEKQGKFMAGLYGKTNIYDFGVCGVDIPAWMAEKEVVGNIHDNKKLLEKGGDQ